MTEKNTFKDIAVNREVRHEYFVDEAYEAGIVLEGAEVKSVREGSVNLKDSFCTIEGGEAKVKLMHVAVYGKAGAYNSRDSKRDRKLLLNKSEIAKIAGKINRSGYTLVPLKMYFKGSLVKLEVGLCRGKHTFDKRATLKERDIKRKAERDIKEYRY